MFSSLNFSEINNDFSVQINKFDILFKKFNYYQIKIINI